MEPKTNIYCVDSSSLIDLVRNFPRDVFPGVWEKLEELIAQGRLISPRAVYREILRGNDELTNWVKKHKSIFTNPTSQELLEVQSIMADYPDLVDHQKQIEDADPFVIAQAKFLNEQNAFFESNHIVVTQESKTKSNKIPKVSKAYGIDSITLLELFRKEGWSFH